MGRVWSIGGCGVPKSRGDGDAERDCDRDVSSFMRLMLRTWRNCSVISVASLSVSMGALCAREALYESMVNGIELQSQCVECGREDLEDGSWARGRFGVV